MITLVAAIYLLTYVIVILIKIIDKKIKNIIIIF